MSEYKIRKNLQTVLALCFSQVPETYHHWHVFANGPAGICIEFDRALLLKAFQINPCVSSDSVEYLLLNEAKTHEFKVARLPFLKRAGFKPEGEFRVIYESLDKTLESCVTPIEHACIRRITLSPWIHKSLVTSTRASIQKIEGCEKLKVVRSTLISNEQRKKFGKEAKL